MEERGRAEARHIGRGGALGLVPIQHRNYTHAHAASTLCAPLCTVQLRRGTSGPCRGHRGAGDAQEEKRQLVHAALTPREA